MSNTETLPPYPMTEPEPSDGSVLGDLRALRERKAADAAPTLDVDVPGTEGRMLIRYGYPASGTAALRKAAQAERAAKSGDADVEANAAILVACCLSVLGRDSKGRIIDLLTDRVLGEHELPDPPLRLDERLAGALGITVPPEVERKGRFIARHLFSPRAAKTGAYDGDLSLIAQADIVYAWLSGAEIKVDEETAGE